MTSMTAETRKFVQNPQVDRRIIRNPDLAAQLDRRLENKDVTAEDLARVNAALKKVLDESRAIKATKDESGKDRIVTHPPTAVCDIAQEHSTLRNSSNAGCGYFRAPREWADVLSTVVDAALAG
jgi:hypothetical protein